MTKNTALWQTRSLKDWGMKPQTGFASGKHNLAATGVPHLRPMNVNRLGQIDLGEVKYVSADAGQHRLLPGDVLFNNTNSDVLVGKTALFDREGEYAFSNHMTRLRFPGELIDSRFMALKLHSLWQKGLFKSICNNHVSQASVSIKMLEELEIALPPLSIQKGILERLEGNIKLIDSSVLEVSEILEKLSMLRLSLMSSSLNESTLGHTK
jgi:type I restriction enzyme S subunit